MSPDPGNEPSPSRPANRGTGGEVRGAARSGGTLPAHGQGRGASTAPGIFVRRERGLLYVSGRLWLLRLAGFASMVPLTVGVGLLTLAPRSEWERAPFGHVAWWLFPAGVIALTLLLPGAMLWVHDRYVTRVVFESDGRLRVTTFVLWGQRTRRYKAEEVAARRFLLDRSGTAPMGFDTLAALGFR